MIKKGSDNYIPKGISKVFQGSNLVYEAGNFAPASTLQLYHFNNSLLEEVSNTSGTGTTSYVNGKFGQATAGQNGTSFLLPPVELTANDFQSGSYTFEGWVKVNANTQFYFSRFRDSNNTSGDLFKSENITQYGLRLSTTTGAGMNPFASTSVTDYVPSSVDLNEFHHIALVTTQGTYKVFFDGKLTSHGDLKTYTGTSTGGNFYRLRIAETNRYYDEFLICASAKYDSDFTPPTKPYTLRT